MSPTSKNGPRVRGAGTVPIPAEPEVRTEADFADQDRSPWRRQLNRVMHLWNEDEIADGEYVQIGNFPTDRKAAARIKRLMSTGSIRVPAITDVTGESSSDDWAWSLRTVREGTGSQLWAAIVLNADPGND